MPEEPMSSQKRTMWVYIFLLVLLIFILWMGFFRQDAVNFSNKQNQDETKSFGSIISEFIDSVKEGSYLVDEIKENISSLKLIAEQQNLEATSTKEDLKENVLSEEQKREFVERVNERLGKEDVK